MRVKCLAQEHNTMSPARAQTRTTCSKVEHTKHEATAPPTCQCGHAVNTARIFVASVLATAVVGFHYS